MFNSLKVIFPSAVIALLIQTNVFAGEHDRDDRDSERHEHRKVIKATHEHQDVWFGDIRHFNERDIDRWHRGRWVRGWHEGHGGWWWVVGGVWYSYLTPVYPYPDPYQPPVVIMQPPPVVTPSSPPPPVTTQYWYHCTNPDGYYPYVPQCASGWNKVPASPPPQ